MIPDRLITKLNLQAIEAPNDSDNFPRHAFIWTTVLGQFIVQDYAESGHLFTDNFVLVVAVRDRAYGWVKTPIELLEDDPEFVSFQAHAELERAIYGQLQYLRLRGWDKIM